MEEIGPFDAKTNLSKIAERVRQTAQPVTLTKRGEPYGSGSPSDGNCRKVIQGDRSC